MRHEPYETVSIPCPACGALAFREVLYQPEPSPQLREAAKQGKVAIKLRVVRQGDALLECTKCLHRWGDAVTRVP